MFTFTSAGYDWEILLYFLIYAVPTLIVWMVAIWFCFTRRRENPKGAMFLGLAILVQFASTAVSYLFPYLISMIGSAGTGSIGMMSVLGYGIMGVSILSNVAMWILVTMAVFARPVHYDYLGGPAFDEQPDDRAFSDTQ